MSTAAARPYTEWPSNGSPMYEFEDKDLSELARLLVVPKECVGIEPRHPLNDTMPLVWAKYRRINAAAAVASYLNNDPDFYRIPSSVERRELHHGVNTFAFVDPNSFGRKLCLTVDEPKDGFIRKLARCADDIHYVVTHPDMLFLRPHLDFRTAKSHLDAGFKISVLSL
jgi:hypothetical protein